MSVVGILIPGPSRHRFLDFSKYPRLIKYMVSDLQLDFPNSSLIFEHHLLDLHTLRTSSLTSDAKSAFHI